MKKQKITRTQSVYIEGPLSSVSDTIDDLIKKYGPDARLDVRIRRDPYDYGDGYPEVSVSWKDDETDDEALVRTQREKDAEKQLRARELETLKHLTTKYRNDA
jgi:hypothetical protein